MYSTTAEYKTVVQELPQNYRMKIIAEFSEKSSINLEGENGEVLYTEDNIVLECENSQNGVNILPQDIFDADFDESAFGTGGFRIGAAAATMFSVRIHNKDEKFSKNELSSAVLKPKITLYDSNVKPIDYVNIGTFFTRNIIVSGTELKLDCSDRMDDAGEIPYIPQNKPCSLFEICTYIAITLNSSFANTVDDLPMLSKIIDDSVFEGYSLRQVISLVAEATGSFAIFNYDGELELKWFTESEIELREDWSKKAIVLNGNTFTTDGNPVKVTGVSVVSGEESKALVGTEEYLLKIIDNPIADAFPEEIAAAVYARVKNTLYIPSVWDRLGGDPSIQVGDIVTVIDNKEPYNPEHYDGYGKHKLYVSQKNWKYNGGFSETYEAQALPKQNKSNRMNVSKRLSRLSKQIVETEKDLTNEMDRRQLALLMFNSAIAGSMGLYQTVTTDENGGEIIYYHDKPKLSDSKIIYTYGENGFAWTNTGWKGDATLWKYGFDKNGNAILNAIYAYTLSADVITSGLLKSKNDASWINLDTGTFSFGKKAIFDLIKIPVLSLDDDGYLSMYGKLRSQLNEGNYCGFISNGFGFFDKRDVNLGVGQAYCGIQRSSSSSEKGFTLIPYSATNYLYKNINVASDKIRLQHGNMSHQAYLELKGTDNVLSDNGIFRLQGNSKAYIVSNSSGNITIHGNNTIHFTNNDGSAYVGSDGTIYAPNYDITSDRELKENIIEVTPNALADISKWKFYEYDLKDSDIHQKLGIMANDAPYEITGKENKSINQYAFTSYVARAVQQLSEIVENQAKEIKLLKEEINKYKEGSENENI